MRWLDRKRQNHIANMLSHFRQRGTPTCSFSTRRFLLNPSGSILPRLVAIMDDRDRAALHPLNDPIQRFFLGAVGRCEPPTISNALESGLHRPEIARPFQLPPLDDRAIFPLGKIADQTLLRTSGHLHLDPLRLFILFYVLGQLVTVSAIQHPPNCILLI